MKKLLFVFFALFSMVMPVSAAEITAPMVPYSGQEVMPEETESFGSGLVQLLENSIYKILPDAREAGRSCMHIIILALLFSIMEVLPNQSAKVFTVVSFVTIFLMTFQNGDALIRLASNTVHEICEYGKLLCPVMTAALAAQGAMTSSSALYMGTSLFTAVLGELISNYFIPMVYVFLLLATASSALGEAYLRKLADGMKGILAWLLKTLMIIFTTYMSIPALLPERQMQQH